MIIIIGKPNTGSEDIQSGYRDEIWQRKICRANNELLKTTNDGRNRTTKSRKNQNAQRKGKVLWNIGSGYYQISRDKRKLKVSISGERESDSKSKYIVETSSKR